MPASGEESELTAAQKRGRIVTSFKNTCAHLEALVRQNKPAEAKEKFKRVTEVYNKFTEVCDDSGVNEDFIVHELFLEVSSLFDSENVVELKNRDITGNSPQLVMAPQSTKPSIFYGETTEFLPWYEAVKVYLKNIPSVEEKIVQLYELTAGDARQAIEGLFYEPKSTATLLRALDTLNKQFGSDEVVSEDFLRTLEIFPPFLIKDVKALRAFINLLSKGLSMSRIYPSLDVLNTQAFMRVIVSKLPDSLRESWVQKLLDSVGTNPLGVRELIKFLEGRLRVLQHPMCSPLRVAKGPACLHTISEPTVALDVLRSRRPPSSARGEPSDSPRTGPWNRNQGFSGNANSQQ